ncbi:MAG: hypothetical protein ACLFWF_06130 [Alphaproteobacteria bacterium]
MNDRSRNFWRDERGGVGCLGWALITVAVLFLLGWLVSLAFGLVGLIVTAVFKAFGVVFSAIFSVVGGILGILLSFTAFLLLLLPGIVIGWLIARAFSRRRERE